MEFAHRGGLFHEMVSELALMLLYNSDVKVMDEETYQRLLAEAKRIDAELEKQFGGRNLIPKNLAEKDVERLKRVEDEMLEVKSRLTRYGLKILNVG
jgi:hypothetical protein